MLGHGGYLGHVNKTIFINSCSPPPPFARSLCIKLTLIGQEVSEKMFEDNCPCMYIAPGQGLGSQPPGVNCFAKP